MIDSKTWLEITIRNIDEDRFFTAGEGYRGILNYKGRVAWQWRGSRCVANGGADSYQQALEDAWDTYLKWEELSGKQER